MYQIVTDHPPYYYAKQEVLITKEPSGEISAWFHGNKVELQELRSYPLQGAIVSSKSSDAKPIAPAYDPPGELMGKRSMANLLSHLYSRTFLFSLDMIFFINN